MDDEVSNTEYMYCREEPVTSSRDPDSRMTGPDQLTRKQCAEIADALMNMLIALGTSSVAIRKYLKQHLDDDAYYKFYEGGVPPP